MLAIQLTIEQQKEILGELFGFELIDHRNDGNFAIHDEEGQEFYGCSENCQFNFSTLEGIFSYAAHRAKNQGYDDAKREIRAALGIN